MRDLGRRPDVGPKVVRNFLTADSVPIEHADHVPVRIPADAVGDGECILTRLARVVRSEAGLRYPGHLKIIPAPWHVERTSAVQASDSIGVRLARVLCAHGRLEVFTDDFLELRLAHQVEGGMAPSTQLKRAPGADEAADGVIPVRALGVPVLLGWELLEEVMCGGTAEGFKRVECHPVWRRLQVDNWEIGQGLVVDGMLRVLSLAKRSG